MLKKILITGVIVGGVGVAVFGTSALSYVHTAGGYVKDAVTEAVPVDFQIDRARTLIKDLAPEVQKNMHLIAKEEVELQRLDEQIAGLDNRLVKEKNQIFKLKGDLEIQQASYRYGGRNYTVTEVRNDLTNRFERFKTAETTLKSLKDIRDAREKSLAAAREKLEGMLASKRQLQVEVENLQARSQMVAAAKATSNYQFDDSQLGRVKELISDLKTRMEVAEKMVNADVDIHDEIPLDKGSPENIEKQITEYFTEKMPVQKTATQREAEKAPAEFVTMSK